MAVSTSEATLSPSEHNAELRKAVVASTIGTTIE
jgi:MFS family permease